MGTAIAPTHGFRPRKFSHDLGQQRRKDILSRGPGLFDVGDIEVTLFGICLDARLIDRGEAGGLQEPIDRLLRRADAGATFVFLGVGRGGGKPADGQRQPARRHHGTCPLIEQASRNQAIGDRLLQILGGATLKARGDLFGKQFKQQFGHLETGRDGWARIA